jgi:hypothetical protein
MEGIMVASLISSAVKYFVVFLLSLTILYNCSEKNNPDPDPPVLPPQSSMSLDLSGLKDDGGTNVPKTNMPEISAAMVLTNWQIAYSTVAFWTGVTTITMAVPITAFGSTINSEPEYQGDLQWKWTRDFWSIYTADLYGKINGSKVEWQMYISLAGKYNDYLWYSGESNIDGTGGTWIFNKSYENPVNYLQVEWHRPDSTMADLRYEVVETGKEDEGSFIFYTYNANNIYDKTCSLFNAADTINMDVEWSGIDQSGRVRSSKYFSDDLWHCWDENRNNTNCD